MDDLISRQEAMRAITEYANTHSFNSHYKGMLKARDIIKQLPKAELQKKTGHWIKTIGENGVTSAVRCSECGFEDNRYMLFRYCPDCGARMVKPQETKQPEISSYYGLKSYVRERSEE